MMQPDPEQHRVVWRQPVAWGTLEVVENQRLRWLHFGGPLRQSCMWRADPSRLVLPYTRHMMAALLLHPRPRRALMVGLGGGSLARFLESCRPACQLEAVEVEPAVVAVARQWFHLPPEPTLRIHLADAARFLQDTPRGEDGGYDLILVDAFDNHGMAKAIQNARFLVECYRRLTPTGVVVINLFQREEAPRRLVSAALAELFGAGALVLPVPGSGNELHLGWRGGTPPWEALGERAPGLARETGLEMAHYLRLLRRHNTSWWQRCRLAWREFPFVEPG